MDILTVKEVATLLRVPAGWIYDRTREGGPERIPFYKLGRHLRFDRGEIIAWVQERHRNGLISLGGEPKDGNRVSQPVENKGAEGGAQ